MVNIEIDGRTTQVPPGSTVMDAAHELGIYVPHFCWHRKLSIAANCRMCLVQIEKAPKPMPACATPVAEGMKVQTHSPQAIAAQKSVMEFLLINHPLDCPICDQGGECQLQDLAVGYGGGASRYQEAKRVVFHKPMGPLISAEEMPRCIHCTRCVRFGQEIAGVMELGMMGRGEHSEIVTFVGRSVDSELSGNMIDICPVGALTSKPFRFAARTWELVRRRSISPHDSLGSNLVVQVKNDRVMRVVPGENDAVNECWLSDKDRFSYEGLDAPDRLTTPLVKRDGQWVEVDWQTALGVVADGLRAAVGKGGEGAIGTLVSPHATLEELGLAARLTRGLGSDNIDFRLRQIDFRGDGHAAGIPWLGMPVTDLNALDRVLVIGSFLRKDHPLIAQRLRQVAKKKGEIHALNPVAADWLIDLASSMIVAPSSLPRALAEIVVAAAGAAGKAVPPVLAGIEASDAARNIAASLAGGTKKAVFLGNLALQHEDASQLVALAQTLAEFTGATVGFLHEAANSVGGHLAHALPERDGQNARAMLGTNGAALPRAFLVVHAEPEFDCANPVAARAALDAAELVVVMSPFRHGTDYADVLLPISPFTETGGTFVNCEGRVQSFSGVVKPRGESRPGWKVLRVLGTMLGIPDFDFESIEDVRAALLPDGAGVDSLLRNGTDVALAAPRSAASTLERVADVPIHFADPLARRAPSLQQTRDSAAPRARASAATLAGLGIADGASVRLRQGRGEAVLPAMADASVPDGVVRIAAAHPTTCGLDGLTGPITLERA